MKILFKSIVLFLAITLSACQSSGQNEQNSTLKVIDKVEFQQKMNDLEGYQLIDVRTKREFESGTIAGSKNMDLLDGTFEKELNSLDKEKPVLVFCAKGGRSNTAANILVENGFNVVYDLKGGYTSWSQK
ncbi:MAG: rhodanese-like domain-containing protein [Flavobacteriales bacterium]|nr:rhodanese-like domain-containing protein [Flavobacteriales bacterium]